MVEQPPNDPLDRGENLPDAENIPVTADAENDPSKAEENERSLDTEQQLARQEVVEFLNERQRHAIDAKESGKRGNYDTVVAQYEALREAANRGNFDIPVPTLDESGQQIAAPVSVRKYLNSLLDAVNARVEKLADQVDQGDETKRTQLERQHELFDKIEEAVKALDKVEVQQAPSASDLPPRNSEDKVNQNRSRKSEEKKNPRSKFNKDEPVTIKSKSGKSEYQRRVEKSFVGKEGKVIVVIKAEGEQPSFVIPEEVLEQWNPRTELQGPDQPSNHEPENGGDNSGNHDDHDNGNAQQPNNRENDDNNHKAEETEGAWLDPNRIQDLREEYLSIIKDQEEQGRTVSEETKDHLKNLLIEREITRTIEGAEQAWHHEKIGKVPAYPSDGVKQRMAEMMDWPEDAFQRELTDAKFHAGQEVKRIKSNGELDEGYIVKGVHPKHFKEDTYIEVAKPGEAPRWIHHDKVLGRDETLEDPFEMLRPFIDNPTAKVKLPNGRIVQGEFRGISSAHPEEMMVYVAGDKDNGLQLVKASEFLSWQGERATAEVEAEEVAELEGKLAKYTNKTVAVPDAEGNWLPNFKMTGYDKENKSVEITRGETKWPVPLDIFIRWQEDAYEEKWSKINPFKEGETVKLTEQQPDGSTIEADYVIKDYEEDGDKILIILIKEGGKEAKIPYEELISSREEGGKPPIANKEDIEEEKEPEKSDLEKWKEMDDKAKADKALGEWWNGVMEKWEAHGTWYRIRTGFLGMTAVGAALATVPGWPASYVAYRTWRKHLLKKKQKELERKEAGHPIEKRPPNPTVAKILDKEGVKWTREKFLV